MNENVTDTVQRNSIEFKKVYNSILAECISRRKHAGLTQEFMAEWLGVSRLKIIEFEKGNGGVGLLLNYADRFDIEINLKYINH